jgi:hypothetical protein
MPQASLHTSSTFITSTLLNSLMLKNTKINSHILTNSQILKCLETLKETFTFLKILKLLKAFNFSKLRNVPPRLQEGKKY